MYPWEHRLKSESPDVAWMADRVEDVEVPSWLPDLPEVLEELAEYYQVIYRPDQGLGFLMEALERQGLADDTLVIFTTDNRPQFINAKTTLYDSGTCLPLLVRRPGAKAGLVNPNMVSFIDMLPTFLDWTGLPLDDSTCNLDSTVGAQQPGSGVNHAKARSPNRLGVSFLPILETCDNLPADKWQQPVFGSHELQNYWPTRVMRDRRFKYHRNIAWRLDFPFASDLYASYKFEGMKNSGTVMVEQRTLKDYLFRPDKELFDLENDPDEIRNLARSQSIPTWWHP